MSAVGDNLRENLNLLAKQEELKAQKQSIPIVTELKSIVDVTTKQNEILTEQNRLLLEENERQKQEVEKALEKEREARLETKRANRRFWLSTAIGIASVVVSVLLHFVD